MSEAAIRARWTNGRLVPITSHSPILDNLDEGEFVVIEVQRVRSARSHKHAFAWVKDAWLNLPEHLQQMPWAETPEHLRKHALIATGFHQVYTLDAGANATAQRVKAALVAAEAKAHGYAIGQVRGPVVTIWTPESQSYRAMGAERFNASKQAILDWIAAQIGVTAADLRGAA